MRRLLEISPANGDLTAFRIHLVTGEFVAR